MGQMEMKCIFDIKKIFLDMSQGFSGEQYGP
jgi:hypothetical protein